MAIDFRTVFQRALPYGKFLDRYATAENKTRWAQVYDSVQLTASQKELLASFRRKMNVLSMSGPWCGDCVNACPMWQRFAEASPLIDLRFVNRVRDFDLSLIKNPLQASATPPTSDAESAAINTGGGDASAPPDDIRSRPIGKILVKWGILSAERVDKALLVQEERKAQGLNVRIGDVLTDLGLISGEQRDKALAAQSGYGSFDAWDVAVARELAICGAPRVPMLVFLSEDWYECGRFGERTLATYRDKARKKLGSMEGATCPTGLMKPEPDMLAANIAEWLGYFERIQWMLLTSPRLTVLHGEA